jgi:hypothetical protein
MSASDGGKPAQTGLVDMGQNHFYDNPANYPPPFLTSDLANYTGSFSEMVLNVAWQQLQPTQGGALNTSAIDSAIAAVTAYNSTHPGETGTSPGGGYTLRLGPEYQRAGHHHHRPGVGRPQIYDLRTIGRWWTGDYINAWTSLQNQLANLYDSSPVFRGISQTAAPPPPTNRSYLRTKVPAQMNSSAWTRSTRRSRAATLTPRKC